jgi:D-alanyl-lipoteichoic acid acyltransferase DltB (MBOAT superfamily)
VFVADNLSRLVDGIFGATSHDTGSVIVGSYAFVFQVFCDFAGYSNMARGLGRMMGFQITVNFNAPLVMANVTEFWTRWHISLATWFRDYFFHPLVRTRRLDPNTALLLTWTLIGLWHGAAWHFVAFGVFTGAYLVAHRLVRRQIRLPGPPWLRYALGMTITFNLAAGSAFLFRVDGWDAAVAMIGGLVTGPWGSATLCGQVTQLLFYAFPVVVMHVGQVVRNDTVWLLSTGRWTRVTAYVVGFYLLLWFGHTGGRAFIYYQF